MEELLTSYYEIAKNIFIVFDKNGKILNVNDHFENYFKVSKNSLISKSIYIFLNSKQKPIFADRIEKIKSLDEFSQLLIINRKIVEVFLSIAYEANKDVYVCKVRPQINIENEYEALFNNMQMGVVVHEPNGSIIKFNNDALKLLSLNADQILGKSSFDPSWRIINEDFTNCNPEEHPSHQAFITGEVQKNKILGVLKSDESIVWLSVTAVPVFRKNELSPHQVLVTLADVTEIKKAQIERNQFFEALDKTFLTTEISLDGFINKVNENLCNLTGYTKEELIGKHYTDLNPTLKDENLASKITDEVHLGKTWVGEIKSYKKNKEEYWLSGMVCPVINEYGRITKYITIRTDITSQKKITKELNEVVSWHKAILNGTNLAIISADVDGRISTFNTAAEQMLGYSAEEIIGQSPAVFHLSEEIEERTRHLNFKYHTKIVPGFETFVYKALHHGPDINEWTYVHKNGKHIPVKLCVTAILNERGKCIGFLGISEDLSEQKMLKEQLDSQRAQMLATAKLSLLGELSAGIAHEINNPLAVIVGKSMQLKRHLASGEIDIKKIEQEIVKIDQMSQRISKTIKGMRLFSRNGENDLFELKSLKQIFDETYQICNEKYRDNNVAVTFDIDENLYINCRPTQISQIILNLLNNAYDAILELDVKAIRVTSKVTGEKIILRFADSGSGIPQEIARRIMEPFYTTKVNGKGTGIGLSISKKIAEEHNGVLYLDQYAKNTTFILELPYQKSLTKVA